MLIVEDDEGLRPSLEESFARKGHDIIGTSTASEAISLVRQLNIAVILLDIKLPDGSGLEVLKAAKEFDDEIIVIMMTAFPDIRTAVNAMKDGASDFVVKPYELAELHMAVERAIEIRSLRRSVRHLRHERQSRNEVTEILGESPAIASVRDEIRKVAEADTPVLVVGETGTGKELVADSIHRCSARSRAPLVRVNCSAFSETLLESELFGHEKGAFTDAKEARAGFFEMAEGGTLFLDEISEMKAGLQAKLLRIVEGQPFRRVGGQREIRVNVRIIAATNRDLKALIRTGDFRQDLYFRINAFRIVVPPLRNRGDDVVALARFFLRRSSQALRKGPVELMSDAEDLLKRYDWPGNVRELRNVMERAAILCDTDEVGVEHLPSELHAAAFVRHQVAKEHGNMPSLAEVDQRYIEYVGKSVDGNLSKAARILGIARNTLKARLRASEEVARDA